MAFFNQPRSEPFLRLPAVVTAVIVALAGAHLFRTFLPPQIAGSILYNYAFIPARYDPAYLSAHGLNAGTPVDQAIPFVSYILLHANWEHLLVNCIWLLPFGAVVARRFGALLFLLFFLVCGIGGAAVHLALNWGSPAPVVGASAAISGLMAAAFRMMWAPPGQLAPIFSSRVLLWSGVWTLINVVAGLTGLGTGSSVQLVAWEAHLGGYFTGLLLAGPFDLLCQSLAARRAAS
jgi:membrane associated rhomboid family serine protease